MNCAMRRRPALPGALFVMLVLTGCAADYPGIGVTPGAGAAPPELRSFTVLAEDMPAFLGPIVVSNFSVAMAERGLQPVSDNGAAVVTLRFEQEGMAPGSSRDGFAERIDQGGDTRFLAIIRVEVRRTGEDAILWQGSIQRMHSIRPGDYMHTGPASVAFLDAFRALLKDYPALREGQ